MQANRSIHILKEISIVQANNLKSSKKGSFYPFIKRTMDLFIASIGIVITLPLILLFAVLIRIDSPGSPFYVQSRVGKNGKCFNLIKLRSMRMDAEKDGEKWAEVNDPRITKIGAFIRKTRIDELPQLFSVLKGDMSIIGPRPERPSFTAQFSKEIKGFSNRLLVKPGLTGLAQVNGGYDITPKEKLKYDLQYINNVTFFLEMKILLKTIKVVLTGEGAR
ncbi:MAG: exopolysaccharide biosynthesis polyprenyl glycosylphosphotransferase [Niallia nealsonii]|nr:exopolysaccharide biosynthesis polyprenyl glycosylphosphotransferase [Niallia nealsonii]